MEKECKHSGKETRSVSWNKILFSTKLPFQSHQSTRRGSFWHRWASGDQRVANYEERIYLGVLPPYSYVYSIPSRRGSRQQVCSSKQDMLIIESHVFIPRLLRSAAFSRRCRVPVSSVPAALNGTTWYVVSVPSLLTGAQTAHAGARRKFWF